MGTKHGITLPDDVEKTLTRALRKVGGPLRCTFCGKTRRQVRGLVANTCPPGVYPAQICNECVGLCIAEFIKLGICY